MSRTQLMHFPSGCIILACLIKDSPATDDFLMFAFPANILASLDPDDGVGRAPRERAVRPACLWESETPAEPVLGSAMQRWRARSGSSVAGGEGFRERARALAYAREGTSIESAWKSRDAHHLTSFAMRGLRTDWLPLIGA
jgi:hypothetical protein